MKYDSWLIARNVLRCYSLNGLISILVWSVPLPPKIFFSMFLSRNNLHFAPRRPLSEKLSIDFSIFTSNFVASRISTCVGSELSPGADLDAWLTWKFETKNRSRFLSNKYVRPFLKYLFHVHILVLQLNADLAWHTLRSKFVRAQRHDPHEESLVDTHLCLNYTLGSQLILSFDFFMQSHSSISFKILYIKSSKNSLLF